MSVQRSAEWRHDRHVMLDEHIKQFRIQAHRLLDRIIDAPFVYDSDFIMSESLQVLPQTVMTMMCSRYKVGPSSKQTVWKAEISRLKEGLK